MQAGLRYMLSWPGMLMIAAMAVVINLLLTPASSLQPILVTVHFDGAALQLAWMESAWGIGMFLGGVLLSAWGGFRRRILTTLLGLVILGIAMTTIGLTPNSAFILAVGMIFLSGVALPIVNGPIHAVMQANVAPEMQGRVFTLLGSAATAMTPLGLIIAGPVADTFGVQTWYIAGGIVTCMIGLVGFFIPAVLNIDNGPPAKVKLNEKIAIPLEYPGD
jgi:DHA3 family macrolide efflux protein-like MFS transporter